MVTFLVAWETMSLACYLLILRHPRSDASARGAFWFLALSEIGFLLVVAAFVILSSKTHATALDAMAARAHLVPAAAGWLRPSCSPWPGSGSRPGSSRCTSGCPRRTRSRPPTGPAFLSGVVVKLGVYGIALFAFRLDPVAGPGPDWSRWAPGR